MTRTVDLTHLVDGVKNLFDATANFIPGSLVVVRSGVRLRWGDDFQELLSPDFEIFTAPVVGDTFQVQFETIDPGVGDVFPLVVPHAVDPTV